MDRTTSIIVLGGMYTLSTGFVGMKVWYLLHIRKKPKRAASRIFTLFLIIAALAMATACAFALVPNIGEEVVLPEWSDIPMLVCGGVLVISLVVCAGTFCRAIKEKNEPPPQKQKKPKENSPVEKPLEAVVVRRPKSRPVVQEKVPSVRTGKRRQENNPDYSIMDHMRDGYKDFYPATIFHSEQEFLNSPSEQETIVASGTIQITS